MPRHVFVPLLLLTLARALEFPEECLNWQDNAGTACCDAIKTAFTPSDPSSGGVADCVVTDDGASLVSLTLSSNSLVSGEIDSDIFGHQVFTQLVSLDLSHNSLNGTIPSSLAGLEYLAELDLSYNEPGFTGGLGDEGLYQLPQLASVDLSGNSDLVGSIHPTISQLENLQMFRVQNCRLNGTLPTQLGQLGNLVRLVLNGNRIEGTIPAEMGNMSNMQYLELNDNLLSGRIPPELASAQRLKKISIERQGKSQSTDSGLSGTIPTELGGLTDLTTLELEGNMLEGGIPSELFRVEGMMHTVDLHNNRLTGSIPPTVKNSQNMEQIYLNNNLLSGPIPSELGMIPNMVFVDLSQNQLTGDVPSAVINLPLLYYFNAAENALDGELDPQIGAVTGMKSPLSMLYLNDNQLTGTLPDGLKNFLSLSQLHLENNNLCGGVVDLHGTTTLSQVLLGGNGFECPVVDYCQWVNSATDDTCDFRAKYGDNGGQNCGGCGGTSTATIVVLVVLFLGVLFGGMYWFTMRKKKPDTSGWDQL